MQGFMLTLRFYLYFTPAIEAFAGISICTQAIKIFAGQGWLCCFF